jgi:anti-sigma regulatory factor (Ser/Thr protein kinase)
MNTMVLTRPSELQGCRVRLPAGPAAAAEARRQVRAAIQAWDVPVDPDVAVLLTSDLVTNAIRHAAGGTITLAVRCARGQLRVDVHGTPCSWPADHPAAAAPGPGLILVTTLSDDWGLYRTPVGQAAYFTLAFQPDPAEGGGYGPR